MTAATATTTLRLGTRASALATTQSQLVADAVTVDPELRAGEAS